MRSDARPDAPASDRLPAAPAGRTGDTARGELPPRPRRRRAGLDAQGRPGRGRRRIRWRRILWAAVALFGVGIALLGALVAYAAVTLPSLSGIGAATGTVRIVDRDGRLLGEFSDTGRRRAWVPINQIAPIMQDAIIAAEDRNFYSEGAFDPARILKALVVDVILQRPAEGASTITEQVAKEAFFGQNATKSVLIKLREALLAQELASDYSKSQILDMYLNLTYFGQSSYGIQEAAERYFGKPAADLDLSEAALLAGLPQAPSADDPYVNPGNAFARMHYVLQGLVETGKISQAQAEAIDPLNPNATANPAHQAAILADLRHGSPPQVGPAPAFVQYVEDELPELLQNDPSALQGSLTVTTTLDLTDQQSADSAVAGGLPRIGGGANNAALLMMNPDNGQVLAWVGSANYNDPAIDGQQDFVTLPGLQPGSSFKPYVYETGFMDGSITPTTMLQDTAAESRTLGGVQDWDRKYEGPITAATALLHSRNIPTEQAAQITGMSRIIAFAHELGVTTPIADDLSSAIGTSATSVLDQALGYSAFANGGHTVTPQTVLRIQGANGQLLWTNPDSTAGETQAMTPAQAWSVTQILRQYPAYWDLNFRWPTAGKSGTTDNYVDAWYMAYTPSWVVATWVGNTEGADNRQGPMRDIFGTTGPGKYIDEPFIDSLGKPAPFQPAAGALPMATATPTPSPTLSPSPTLTPTASPSASPSAQPTPSPPPLSSPSPSSPATAAPTSAATPGSGAQDAARSP